MDKTNLRERKPKNEATSDKSKSNLDSKKNDSNNKTSWGSCCVLVSLFLLPLLLLPLFPYLRIDTSIEAHYVKLSESPKFEGNLKSNDLLQKATHYCKGKINGPETILFVNDSMYAGVSSGQIVRIDDNCKIHKIAQIGDGNEELCTSSLTTRSECGRPLGIRYKSNYIYVADAYLGIYKVDLRTNQKHVVVAANGLDEKLEFTDDLDIDDDGNIYFTVSSKKRDLEESVELHFEAIPDGRVFHHNEKTKKTTVLLDKLVFPNGIQLSPANDFLIIAEHGKARLLKYYLKGAKKGQQEVFLNLPGFPDNVRLSDHNTLFVALVVSRNPNPFKPSVLDLLGEYPTIRTILGRVIDINKLMFQLPKHALAVEYDLSDSPKIVRSWHDPTGEIIKFVTCVTQRKNKLYLGSFIDDYIGIVDY